MQINGNNFKVYLSDTVDTIKNRIATTMNTLPQYLVFNPEIKNPSQTGNILVTNVLRYLLNSVEVKFPEEKIDFSKISREDAERFFIATHDLNNDKVSDVEVFLDFVITGLTALNARAIWKDRANIKKNLYAKINKLKDQVNETVRTFEEFENIPSISTTEYEVSTVQFTIRFTQESVTVAELFNSISVTKMVPYANTGSFYKVFHDFAPSSEWLELETANVILLKVDDELTSDLRQLKNSYKKYTNAAFTIIDNEIVATLTMNVGHRNVDRNTFIDRTLNVFPNLTRQMITRVDEQATGGYITYPNQTILIPIWAEMCMNNPFFKRIVALNESIKASKIKLNAYVYVLNTDDILSITMQETNRANMYGMEDEGSNYIRVRVKAKTIADSVKYQQILGRLFTLYNNERDLIIADYRKFLGSKFLKDEQTKLIVRHRKLEKLELRAIAPDIFLPTYSRKCLKRPTIVSKEQAAEYRRTKERQVMEFPAHGESTKRAYVCEHETHPYPGLRDNTLENKNKFPYIPCCYTKDQNREGTKFRYYYAQDQVKEKSSANQDIFISGKTMAPGLPGTLPVNIKELFSLIEPNPEYQFVRVGSNITKNSFLECVMLALNIEGIQYLQVEDRIPIVERMRTKIATPRNAMAAKQEFYDEPVSSILDKLRSANLNALEFGHVMEMVFSCSIFVFSASDKDPSGTIHIPRHTQAYYKMKPTRSTIFIYQHDIHSSDTVSEVQCELITRTKTPDVKVLNNMQTSFPYFDKVVEKMWGVFKDINRSFSHNTMLPSISLPRLNVKSQLVDIYGKCRVVNIDHNGSMLTMVSEPLPPYNADKATQVYRASLSVLRAFGKANRVVFTKQRTSEGRVREVDATIRGNLNVTFLSDDPGRLDSVVTTDAPKEYDDLLRPSTTVISKLSHNKKIAKVIYQYSLYFLSRFMNTRGYTTGALNEQQLGQFIREHVVIRSGYDYTSKNMSSKFSLESQFVENRAKVITTSREMLIRLMYMLRLYQNTHFDKLLNYKDRIHIDGFYDEISDFDERPSQFVLDSPEAVKGLVDSYKTNNMVTKNVRIGYTHPYFMYNTVIGDRIYLAQNVDPVYERDEAMTVVRSGLEVAVNLVRFWNRYGYNAYKDTVFEHPEHPEHPDVDVYSYMNTEEIINLTNHVGALEGLVLGYLVNGESKYTALMPL